LPNEVVSGGGFTLSGDDPGSADILSSKQEGTNSWEVAAVGPGNGHVLFQPFVICLRLVTP
jgi:hypothetical protein